MTSTSIPVFNKQGEVDFTFTIDDSIEYVNGRVSRGTKRYYKGIGVPYTRQRLYEIEPGYTLLGKDSVFYQGLNVTKDVYKGKFGIFPERFQMHFTDWIGACGVKELQLIENLWELGFDRSAIEVFGWTPISEEHQQYYMEVDYPQGRDIYLDNPHPAKLQELLEYMLANDWNFPWDKKSITDINPNGLITDVADIFQSKELMHKFGGVYSAIYSLMGMNRQMYNEFCEYMNLPYQSSMSPVLNTLSILAFNGVDTSPIVKDNVKETYINAVLNYLVQGKNCGFCGVGSCKRRDDDNQSYGEWIRDEHYKRARKSLTGQ